MTRFCTIASGSSGNCTYIGIGGQHLLVDAGISGKRVREGLMHLEVQSPTAILVTHEHSDHISGVGVIARRYGIPVYATPFTWRYFLRHERLGPLRQDQVRHITPGTPVQIGSATVTAFDIPHDASQPVGYTFEANGSKLAYATDLGKPTEDVISHIKNANLLLIESNYDPEMLEKGRYHADLKARVASPRGHLSNVAAGQLIVEVAWEGLQHVVLGHLSEENNRPMLAYDTVGRIMDAKGVKAQLSVAERYYLGEIIEI